MSADGNEAPAFWEFSLKYGSLKLFDYVRHSFIDEQAGTHRSILNYSRMSTPAGSKLNLESSHSSVGASPAGFTSVPAAGIGVPSSSSPVPLLMKACSVNGSHSPFDHLLSSLLDQIEDFIGIKGSAAGLMASTPTLLSFMMSTVGTSVPSARTIESSMPRYNTVSGFCSPAMKLIDHLLIEHFPAGVE